MTQLFNQCAPAWASHPLGWWKPGTICEYGCFNCTLAAIANDSGHPCTPPQLDQIFTDNKIFVKDSTGTFDLLPDNALDLVPGWSKDYRTEHYDGFRADIVKYGVSAPDCHVYFWITGYSPGWKMNILTHFVMAWSADGKYVGDPQGGIVRALSFYGGPINVHKTGLVRRLKPITTPPAPVVTVKPPVPSLNTPPVNLPPVTPLFTWKAADGSRLETPVAWEAVQQTAQAYAAHNVGVIVEILDAKNQVVGTAFVAPAPGPVTPVAVPHPTPLPAPARDFWAELQSIIIVIGLQLRGVKVQR